MPADFSILVKFVNLRQQRIFPAEVQVRDGRIAAVTPSLGEPTTYLLPGFIDAHVHVEKLDACAD